MAHVSVIGRLKGRSDSRDVQEHTTNHSRPIIDGPFFNIPSLLAMDELTRQLEFQKTERSQRII